MGILVGNVLQFNQIKHFSNTVGASCLWLRRKTKTNIPCDIKMREKREILKHHPYSPSRRGSMAARPWEPLARGRIGQQAPQSASDTQPVELRIFPFSST